MSSETGDQNFNNKAEQLEIKTELTGMEKQHSNENIVDCTDNGLIKKENTENMEERLPIGCDGSSSTGQLGIFSMEPNLNTTEILPKAENPKKEIGISSCDNCSIAENIHNTVAEKQNINLNNDLSCDNSNIVHKNTITPIDRTITQTLIQKTNELNISGKVDQSTQSSRSTVILKKETDSLKNLLVYDNSSDDDDDFEKNWQLLALPDGFSNSESDSNDSIVSSSEDDTDDISSDIIFGQKDKGAIKKYAAKKEDSQKISGDLNLQDLPPIPDMSALTINYEKEEFLHMGHIAAIIDTLVTVEALPDTPAYDLDSYLFVEDKTTKKPLGMVYDVVGPVAAPIYCIRFNTAKDIQDLNLKQGLKVFSAPKSPYTHYIFLKELMKIKGTDASWVADAELPPEVAAEMSDDEDDSNLQESPNSQKRKHSSLERHKEFEKSMNRCNTLNTRVAQLVDAHRRLPRPNRHNNFPQRSLMNDFCSFSNRLPAPFDPTVPPPGFHCYPRESNGPNTPHSIHWGWLPHDTYSSPRGPPNTYIQGQSNAARYHRNNFGRNHAAGPSTQP